MKPLQTLDNVCQSLMVPPKVCEKAKDINNRTVIKDPSRGFWFYVKVFLFSVGAGLIGIVVFYVVYKLKLRIELKGRVQEEVENALSKYYQDTRVRNRVSGVDSDD